MRPDGLATLRNVRTFLQTNVLPDVPPDYRGEVRAALKLLDGAERELTVLPMVLVEELGELGELCVQTELLLGIATDRPGLGGECGLTVPQLSSRHEQARMAVTRALCALQEHLREPLTEEAGNHAAALDLLAETYETLGRHAERRLPWQSVFSPSSRQGAI